MPSSIRSLIFIVLISTSLLLMVFDLTIGSVDLTMAQVWAALTGGDCPAAVTKIVCHIRLVKILVAIIVGVALPVCGLQMQTLFRNPLAGPYVLGVSSGASLGVAIFVMAFPAIASMSGDIRGIGVVGSAWIGASAVMAIILLASRRIKNLMVILVLGIMIGSAMSAIVQILQYSAEEDTLKSFIVWTMGSLGGVTRGQLPMLAIAVAVGIIISVFTVKPLNMLLLGEEYALTLGLNMRRTRQMLFLATVFLAGSVTAFCGPIGFIGLAVPHLGRAVFSTADHRILLPASALIGIIIMLVCDILSKKFLLPVNALTALIGIPVIIWIIIRNKSMSL